MKKFKDIIISLRREIGFNQAKLADELGVSKSTIAMWETGNRFPSKELYAQIADYFNVAIDYLYGRSDHGECQSDQDIRIIQRERTKMDDKQKEKLMNILKANFDDYNWENDIVAVHEFMI